MKFATQISESNDDGPLTIQTRRTRLYSDAVKKPSFLAEKSPLFKESGSGYLKTMSKEPPSGEISSYKYDSDELKENIQSVKSEKPPRFSMKFNKRIIISNKFQIDSCEIKSRKEFYLLASHVGKKKTKRLCKRSVKDFYPNHYSPKLDQLKPDDQWCKRWEQIPLITCDRTILPGADKVRFGEKGFEQIEIQYPHPLEAEFNFTGEWLSNFNCIKFEQPSSQQETPGSNIKVTRKVKMKPTFTESVSTRQESPVPRDEELFEIILDYLELINDSYTNVQRRARVTLYELLGKCTDTVQRESFIYLFNKNSAKNLQKADIFVLYNAKFRDDQRYKITEDLMARINLKLDQYFRTTEEDILKPRIDIEYENSYDTRNINIDRQVSTKSKKLKRKRKTTKGPPGKRAFSINKFFTHCPKEVFREKHDLKGSLLPPKSGKEMPAIHRNRVPTNCSLSKNKAKEMNKVRPLSGISHNRRVQQKSILSNSRREEPRMCHYSKDRNSKTKYLDVPTFKEILGSVEHKSLLTKDCNREQSFSLMRDLNKKKEFIARKHAFGRFENRAKSSRPGMTARTSLRNSRSREKNHETILSQKPPRMKPIRNPKNSRIDYIKLSELANNAVLLPPTIVPHSAKPL
ncbi:unnamed protein product [Moneuplotes crassus]|uniref:Uncharacterized protein n=1 Tax=Euplotes crassus TaxID=5936 RepID=A0AAD2DBG7_EUPCR|nr:unnamed protein product [Moneuplotes crassus]